MPKKNLIPVLFTVLIVLSSCVKTEPADDIQELNQTIANYSIPLTRNGEPLLNCATYVPRTEYVNASKKYNITYNSSLSLKEIDCLRMEYFEASTCLHQDPNTGVISPYQDIWIYGDCRPEGSEEIDEAIDEDDRLDD